MRLVRGVACSGLRTGAAAIRNCNVAVTSRVIAFACHDLVVVVGSELQSGVGPSAEMGAYVDGSARTLVLAHGPELLEGLSTVNGWLLNPSALSDVVDGSIQCDLAFSPGVTRGVIRAKVFNNVVLNQRISGPTVNSKIRISIVLIASAIGHDSVSSSWVPSLATDQIATGSPLDLVVAASAVGVRRLRAVVGPPRIEETIMGSLRTGCTASRSDVGRRERECTDGSRDSDEEGLEGNHGSTK